MLAFIGNAFQDVGDEVLGICVSVKQYEEVVSVWNKTAASTEAIVRIREVMKEAIEIDNNAAFEYRPHSQAIKNTAQFQLHDKKDLQS